MKAKFVRSYGPIHPDERDQEILEERAAMYLKHDRPKVGHWVRFPDGTMRRISYIWHDDDPAEAGVQTSNGGSFHLSGNYMSFSGSLYRSIPESTLAATPEQKAGLAWFFHHGFPHAHSGVHFQIPCAVWECSEPAPTV